MTHRHKNPGTPPRQQRGRRKQADNLPPKSITEPHGRLAWISKCIMAMCLAAVVFILTYRPVADPDTWFHLKLGQYIAKTSTLPHTDPFSYTAGATPYVPSGWLTSVLMERLDRIYPESSLGPILMVTTAIAIASLVVMLRAWRAGTVISTGLLFMGGLCMAVIRFSPRPDVWSLAGIAILLTILTSGWKSSDDHPRHNDAIIPSVWKLWMLTPLIVLWANLHAGVLVVIPFLFTFAAWLLYQWIRTRNPRTLRAIIPIIVASFVWLANPYGVGLVGLAWRIAHIPDVSWVMEWMPFFKQGFPLAFPVYIMATLLTGAAIWVILVRRRAIHPLEVLWILMLIAMALLQRRQVGLMAVGLPLLLARHLPAGELMFRRAAPWFASITSIALACLVCWFQVSGANGNGGGKPGFGRNCTVLPCLTSDYLAAHRPPANIFNSYNLGAYLLYRLSPETKVYIDGRLDAYPHQVWQDLLAVEESRLSIDELVARYGIQTFVIGVADSFGDPMHLATRLAKRPDYMLVHLDDLAGVFVHRGDATLDYLVANAFKTLTPWDLDSMASSFTTEEMQNRIIDETGRLLQQSGGSATAHAFAGYVAWLGGDTAVMNEQLALSQQIEPGNRLLAVVKTKISATGRAR